MNSVMIWVLGWPIVCALCEIARAYSYRKYTDAERDRTDRAQGLVYLLGLFITTMFHILP